MLALQTHPGTLSNLNIRIERHGDDRQLAADLKLSMNVAGAVLNDLEPGLHESLFRKPAAAGEQPDLIDPSLLTAVKFPHLDPISLSHKFPGYEVEISDEVDGEPVFFADVEIKKISAKALEGGSAALSLTASVNIDSDDARELTDLLVREDVYVTLKPPKAKAQLEDLSSPGAPRNEEGERCESDAADCGPVAHHDVDGIPLCQRCYDELPALDEDAANDADGAGDAAA